MLLLSGIVYEIVITRIAYFRAFGEYDSTTLA